MDSPIFDADMVALHRYAVIAEALPERLTAAERGHVVRMIAARTHVHPDGGERQYSRGTVDRWIREWRRDGLVVCGHRNGPIPARSGRTLNLLMSWWR